MEQLPSSSSQYILPNRPQFHMQIDLREDFFFPPLSFHPPLKVYGSKQKSAKKKKKWKTSRVVEPCVQYTGYSKAANLASLSSWLHNMSQKVLECGLCRLLFTSFNVTASLFLALRAVNERRLVQVGQRDVSSPNLCASAACLPRICLSVNPRET